MSPPTPLPNRVKLSERHNPSDTNQITKNLSTKCNTVAKLLSWFRAVGTGAACGDGGDGMEGYNRPPSLPTPDFD